MVIITEVEDDTMNGNGALVPRGQPLVVADGFRGNVLNADGSQAVKGGQTVDSGFWDSIVASYCLLIYHPIALSLLIFGAFILVAEYHTTDGPLESMAGALLVVSDNHNAPYIRAPLMITIHALGLLTAYKMLLGKACLLWFSYIVKPSKRNMWFALILTAVVLAIRLDYLELFIISQAFYLAFSIRRPLFKVVFAAVIIAILVFGFFDMSHVMENIVHTHVSLRRNLPEDTFLHLQARYPSSLDHFNDQHVVPAPPHSSHSSLPQYPPPPAGAVNSITGIPYPGPGVGPATSAINPHGQPVNLTNIG